MEGIVSERKSERAEETSPALSARAQDVQCRRKFAMAVLDQLQQDFAAMGKARQAKPLLQELMILAKTTRPRSGLLF